MTMTHTASEDLQIETSTCSAYEGDLLAASSWPAPLYAVRMLRERGKGVDRLRTVYTDRGGRAFFTQTVDFEGNVVAPARLESFAVRVVREPARANEAIPEVKAGRWLRLRIEPESAILRLVAPTIQLVVDAKTGRTALMSGPIPSPDPAVGTIKKGTLRYH
jgi:hypothetical protein